MVNIIVRNLSVKLRSRSVIDTITAQFPAGKLTGIIGPNGAGKSTLLRAIMGLIPQSAGEIIIDQHPLHNYKPRELAKKIAYLPQGQIVNWPISVERLISLGRLPHLAPFARIGFDDHRAIDDAMRRADVTHLAGRIANELSGGERARVMLARALAVGAGALIADEPLASLDPGHQIDVMSLLAQEAKSGSTVIVVLHDLTMAARYCDRLLLLNDGRVAAEGSVADVITTQQLQSVYGINCHIDLDGDTLMVVPQSRSML